MSLWRIQATEPRRPALRNPQYHDIIKLFGAGGGSRTHTGIRPTDFKSGMSTIPSRPHGLDQRVTLSAVRE